ncbi:MAG: putative aminohydrolase SsnA [Calditrichaceae bacterium]|nr:putative aminohydrolase SsnA [Calditrichaceae bacterium]
MSFVITDGFIYTNHDNQILEDHALVVEDNIILDICSKNQAMKKYPDFNQLDAGGKLIMPGWINAHTHFYSAFGRGILLNAIPQNFPDILKQLWWKLDRALDEEGIYYSALTGAVSAIKHGVTAVIDHHASPNAIEGSLDHIQKALDQAGLKGILCYEVTDRNGKEQAKRGLEENRRFISLRHGQIKNSGLNAVQGMVGLHASFTLKDDTLDAASDLAKSLGTGCHFHLAEDKADQWQIPDQLSSTERMHQHGILGGKSLAIHGIHLREEDMDLLAETRTMMVHNPRSNMNNGVGRAPVERILSKGITMGIGTDGMSQDILQDLHAAFLLLRHGKSDPRLGWKETQKMGLECNAAIFNRLTGQNTGVLRPGAAADMVLSDYQSPAPLTGQNFWTHILYGFSSLKTDTVIIDGRIVMEKGRLVHVDEDEIFSKARECAGKTWQRFSELK